MEKELVTSLMEHNLLAIKTFVEMLIKPINEELVRLREENYEIKRSLEFSQGEIDELKSRVPDKRLLDDNTQEVNNLCNRTRTLEDYNKRKNIRITGMKEVINENNELTQKKVQLLLTEKLKLPNVVVSDAFRAGKSDASTEPRPIIAKLASVADKISCFKASGQLKGTTTYINDDVSKATLDIRRQKLDFLKEKRREGYIAYFSGTDVVVKRRPTRSDGKSANNMSGRPDQNNRTASVQSLNQLDDGSHGDGSDSSDGEGDGPRTPATAKQVQVPATPAQLSATLQSGPADANHGAREPATGAAAAAGTVASKQSPANTGAHGTTLRSGKKRL